MKVFLVQATNCDYDQNDACVIIADNEEKVMMLIEKQNESRDSFYQLFYKEQYPLKIQEVGLDEECLVIESFNAG